jgi:uncharacterized membrane protein YjjP (DUF1212 family)
MSDADKKMTAIMDLGKALLTKGAVVWEVEDLLTDIFKQYGFVRSDIIAMSNYLYVTVWDMDDKVYTQVRRIRSISRELDKLEKLLTLAHMISIEPIDIESLNERVKEIITHPGMPMRIYAVCSIIGAGCFAAFYNGDLNDVLVACIVGAVLPFVHSFIMDKHDNNLTVNLFSSFLMEVLIIVMVMVGIGHDTGHITSSCLLLLISSLGLVGGISQIMHGQILSGIANFLNAILGALGIAAGILLAFYLIPGSETTVSDAQGYVSDPILQTLYCCFGCIVFAKMIGVRNKSLLFSAIGTVIVWGAYLLMNDVLGAGVFITNVVAAAAVALFSISLTKLTKIPATVLFTTCVYPLLPGSYLYRVLVGIFTRNNELIVSQGGYLGKTCLGIVVGFIVVEVLLRYIEAIAAKIRERREKAG